MEHKLATPQAVCLKCVEQGLQIYPWGIFIYIILCRTHQICEDSIKESSKTQPDIIDRHEY